MDSARFDHACDSIPCAVGTIHGTEGGGRVRIFAMGDIHGCIEPFERRLEQLDELGFFDGLDTDPPNGEDLLVLLGDYIDRGPDGLAVVRKTMELEHRYPAHVIPLMGNHEAEFLFWVGAGEAYGDSAADPFADGFALDSDLDFGFGLDSGFDAGLGYDFDSEFGIGNDFGYGPDSSLGLEDDFDLESRLIACRQSDRGFATIRSFLGPARAARFVRAMDDPDAMLDVFAHACETITGEHADAIRWMKGLRLFHETERQIFVHAGLNEASGSEWKLGTSRETMLGTRRIAKGTFIKDIIVGHTGTASISKDESFHDVFWDGASHFYVDGTTVASGSIPVLVFESGSGAYSSLQEDGSLRPIR